jgi:hypothetical protein
MIMFVLGMGFFTDAYDLFIIGVALTLIKNEWHLATFHTALVGSTSLISAAFGALIFGRIADVLGRKRIYDFEVLVLAAGAISWAFSPNFWWLIAFRFILGLDIDGDYPTRLAHLARLRDARRRADRRPGRDASWRRCASPRSVPARVGRCGHASPPCTNSGRSSQACPSAQRSRREMSFGRVAERESESFRNGNDREGARRCSPATSCAPSRSSLMGQAAHTGPSVPAAENGGRPRRVIGAEWRR